MSALYWAIAIHDAITAEPIAYFREHGSWVGKIKGACAWEKKHEAEATLSVLQMHHNHIAIERITVDEAEPDVASEPEVAFS